MISSVTPVTGLAEYATALIGLWAMFVVGVSVGIWLGVTWWKRMSRWAGKVVELHEAERGGNGAGGADGGLPAGGEGAGVRSQGGVPGRFTRLREIPDDVRAG